MRETLKSTSNADFNDMIYSAMSTLTASEMLTWVLLDEAFETIAASLQAQKLIKRLFSDHQQDDLPEELKDLISRSVQKKCRELSQGHPCAFKLYLKLGDLLCYLYPLQEEGKRPTFVLKLIPNGPTEDFSILINAGLTKRETAVLSFLPLGYENSQIAVALDISKDGVKKHLSNIARKMDASGRAEILYKALLKKRELNSKKVPEPNFIV